MRRYLLAEQKPRQQIEKPPPVLKSRGPLATELHIKPQRTINHVKIVNVSSSRIPRPRVQPIKVRRASKLTPKSRTRPTVGKSTSIPRPASKANIRVAPVASESEIPISPPWLPEDRTTVSINSSWESLELDSGTSNSTNTTFCPSPPKSIPQKGSRPYTLAYLNGRRDPLKSVSQKAFIAMLLQARQCGRQTKGLNAWTISIIHNTPSRYHLFFMGIKIEGIQMESFHSPKTSTSGHKVCIYGCMKEGQRQHLSGTRLFFLKSR
jgi:hypothetical protein